MSQSNGNGKPARRPRTASHEPANGATDGKPSGGEDRSQGILDDQGEPTVSPVSNGRAPGGRFAEKNGFGRGNPNARRVHELRLQFLDAVHPDTIPALARKLQVAALKDGDEFAIRTLLEYTLGKPQQAVALTDADGGPLGVQFNAIKAVLLGAFADDSARRLELAARLMELDDDAGDADTH